MWPISFRNSSIVEDVVASSGIKLRKAQMSAMTTIQSCAAHQNTPGENHMCGMSFYMACTIALTFVVASGCYAQTLNIWPGVAPGSATWTQKEKIEKSTPIGAVVFNVVTPTLTPYLPERTKATGTGIIIAPGGAFVALAIDLEEI